MVALRGDFFFLFSFFLKRKPSVWSNRDLSDANVTRILDKLISLTRDLDEIDFDEF